MIICGVQFFCNDSMGYNNFLYSIGGHKHYLCLPLSNGVFVKYHFYCQDNLCEI